MGKKNFKWHAIIGLSLLLILGTFQNCGAPKSKDNLASSESNPNPGGGDTSVPPTAPNQLALVVKSAQQIDLSWVDNSNSESGFKIERQQPLPAGGVTGFSVIHITGPDAVFYSDTGLQAGITYTYRVSAINAAGSSSPSSEMSATTSTAASTKPKDPSMLTATAAAATVVNLQWQDNSSDETYFKIERSAGGGAYSNIATVSANETTYQDINLNAATTYSYRVYATNAAGNSAYTAVANATTPAAGNVNTFAYVNANILAPNCLYCHGGATTSAGVSFASYNSTLATVKKGNSAMSSLYTAVNGNMPPGGKLSAAQIAAIKGWIDAGGLDN